MERGGGKSGNQSNAGTYFPLPSIEGSSPSAADQRGLWLVSAKRVTTSVIVSVLRLLLLDLNSLV